MDKPPVLPLFDSPEHLMLGNVQINQHITELSVNGLDDAGLIYQHACEWLFEQKHHENNYKSYRSELTSFLHWCFDVAKLSLADIDRKKMAAYVDYCQHPPQELIAFCNQAQFKLDKVSQLRLANPKWRPFLGKKRDGIEQVYQLSDNALKTKLAILSSFYSYLIGEEYCERNPAQIWLNYSKFSRRSKFKLNSEEENLLSFTELQWSYVIATAQKLAAEQPSIHQRSLFLIRLLYSCYLRISEVSARVGYSPVMGQFKLNQQTGIWSFYVPISKGGKSRSIPLSKAMLQGLIDYRRFLGLADLPMPNDTSPLFIRHRAAGHGREVGELNANLGIRQLRDDVEFVIQTAAQMALKDGFSQDSIQMAKLTAHNIRHTGITHDINLNGRPLSHVQADAGHESIDTTSQYLHTSQVERHQTAFSKPMDRLGDID
ncbi:tyrosine-type recombinase/integrase [Shewanella marina]|uniref:tyrosine-type recombinase/integrase n=1 Tax=Shewanella marina TaxID=487319 RepID=UPI000471E15E|nr:site-specific integrase [Shewanella marina]